MKAVKATCFDDKMNFVIHFILAYIVSPHFMFIYLLLLTYFFSLQLFVFNFVCSFVCLLVYEDEYSG